MTDGMECIVELCTKPAELDALCGAHRKKWVKGQLDADPIDRKVWDTCSRGHRWTGSNIHWERIPGKATSRRRCRKCLAIKAMHRRRGKTGAVTPPAPVRPENIGMAHAIDSLDKALSVGDAKCKGKAAKYTDYTADSIPTPEEAKAACAGCPFYEACGNGAYAQRPGWGIWAGEVWVYGEVFDESKRGILDDDD